ncbi:MAG: hypothetical protein OXN89_19220 [Bryobacterales bacterium]|nr:hypothetical protein [Bryobacterales bacterium]
MGAGLRQPRLSGGDPPLGTLADRGAGRDAAREQIETAVGEARAVLDWLSGDPEEHASQAGQEVDAIPQQAKHYCAGRDTSRRDGDIGRGQTRLRP